jgi:hypothetical protein
MNAAPRRQRREPARLLISLAEDVNNGATIVEALAEEARAQQKYGRFQPVVGKLAARASKGLSLRQLFGEYPQHFPEPVVAKLAEADRNGTLALKLTEAASLLDQNASTRRGRIVGRFRSFGVVKKLLTLVVAVATGIAAVWGGVKAVEEAVHQVNKWRSEPTELVVTPHLGLQVWQDGAQRKMFFDDRVNDVVRIPMKSRPFTLRFPKRPHSLGLHLTAWTNDSIFVVKKGNPERTPFLGPGRGMADTEYGSGTLGLTNQAHNFFAGDRIASASNTDDGVFVSTISEGIPESKRTPLTHWHRDLFLVAWIDKNKNYRIDLGEYEYLRLDF